MKKRVLSLFMALILCLSLLPMSALAEEISWPEIGSTVRIDNVDYTYKGDFTSLPLDLTSSNYPGSCIFKAGNGYVLCNKNTKKVILYNAEITASYALEVPSGAEVTVEGNNTLHGTGSYALVCYSGRITVTGSGSLSTLTDSTGSFDYAVNAVSGDISIDIAGDFTSNGIQAQSSNVTVKSGGTVEVTGLVRADSAVTVEAGDSLSITNTANMAVQSINSGSVSLTAKNGNITVSGGRNYAGQYNAIQATNGSVTLDASGEIQVAGYNGYPGIGGGSLTVSGTIPAGTTLHTNCAVIVPAGKTLVNNGTLSLNSGGVTVEGTLSYGAGSSIQNGSGTAITPTTTGNGSISTAPVSASRLDFRFNAPDSVTEYVMTGGGTAKWEPGNGTANKLTLNGVTMNGESYVVGVPANTEIILIGTNKITATSANALCAHNGTLKIIGDGSLEVHAPAPNITDYAIGTNIGGNIDIDITGALTVNGNIRANDGTLSLQSGDSISVTGSVSGKGSITATAGKSLSITNTNGTAVCAFSCTEVSLAAQNGNLTVSGTGSNGYGIDGIWNSTALKLHASGNVSVTGTEFSMKGNTLELSGTIPENSTLTADGTKSLTVPAGKTLINNGTIKLISFPGAVTVLGTLTNNGSIFNETNAPIPPEVSGNGVITVKVAMDFTEKNENASGQGYEWDYSSKTLTLTDYKMTEPCNDTAIILPDGAKLVLSGENTLNSKNGALIDAKGTLEISGTGSLTGSAGGEAALNAQGALTITDCKLDLTNPSPWKNVICTNENALTIADRADVSLHTAESSGWGIKTGPGGNFTLGSDAKLVIKGGTGILAEGASVKIAGTLDVSGCANLGANLLRVALNMEGSSITAPTKDKGGIYLYQNAAGTLTGQTDIKAFVGNFRVTSPNASIVNYYKVKKDDTLGLYAEGSTVSFTAEQKSGKAFSGWTATGVTLDNETNAEISFTMPGNDVTLSTAYVTLVSGITLDKTELALTVGDTQTLAATILPSDAANKSVSWSSDKPSVATVDENGKVTAVAEGTAKITVTTVDGKKTADCAVTVTAKSGGGSSSGGSSSPSYPVITPSKTENGTVTVSPRSAEKGDTVTITAKPDSGYQLDDLTVTDKNGKELKLTDKGNGKYTFTMPASKVEVNATFVKEVETSPFSDVSTSAYYYEAVKWAQEKGITGGIGNGLFGPNQPCTRAQIVTFLWRAAGSPEPKSMSSFSDVSADSYYAKAVAWAVENGITTGTGDGKFSPDATCTREQSVTFLFRAIGKLVDSKAEFSDVLTDSYYANAVAWAVENGVTNGIGDGLFGPDNSCTRAQIVTFLFRAYQGK